MADLTEDELRRLAQAAYDRGDATRARSFIRMLQSAGQQAQAEGAARPVYDDNGGLAAMRPPRADAGYSEPSPPQEPSPFFSADSRAANTVRVLGDIIKSTGSGVARGATQLFDMPGELQRGVGNALEFGVERVMGASAPEWSDQISDIASVGPLSPRPGMMEEVVRAIPGGNKAIDFQPQTTAGDYAQNVGEFLPGAMLFGGAGPSQSVARAGVENAIRYGLIPGLASEAAGQATEGTQFEPYARTAAALGSGILAARPSNTVQPLTPRADPEDARMAGTLMQNGIRPTVGQVTRSGTMRRIEGTLGDVPGQAEDLTAAAMRTTGSTATRATPEALAQASKDIVKAMDDAVAGVSFIPSTQMAQQADDVVRDYLRATAEGNVIPDVRNIAGEIVDAATTPRGMQISLATLKDWRSRLGRLMQSNDNQVREAAYGLRSLIDDATTAQLQASGRTEDVARLATAREQYRNWLGVADAATRATAENGILSPTQLHQAIIRTQGRRNVAVGNTTPLGNLSRSAAGVLRPEGTVQPGGVRELSQFATGTGAGGLIGAQMTPGNPLTGGVIGALVGGQAVSQGQAVMRSRAVQNLLMDPQGQVVRALIASGGGVAANQ
jgi:hypothetical protein